MDKYILISIHDINPIYEKEIDIFLKELTRRHIKKFSMLITPLYEGVETTKAFADKMLKNKSAEVILHGYDHYDGKYINSDEKFIIKQLKKGIFEFKKYYHIMPRGYVPPVWKSSRKLNNLLSKYFDYSENFYYIIYFKNHKIIRSFPLGMESMSNNKYFKYDKITQVFTKILSHAYARISGAQIIRYALHPREVNNGNFDATLKLLDYMIKKGFKPITYSELEKLL